jgi:branched-chain amino acid transport system ATP-binding protein
MAILIIDKSVAELAKLCDRATVLERGATVWSGEMKDLTPEIGTRYIGV